MLIRKLRVVLVGGLAFATPTVMGCGPFFPEELIPTRKEALFEPPPALFAKEIQKMVDAPLKDLPVEEVDDPQAQRAQIEAQQAADGMATKIAAMRQAADGDAAYALGQGLPEALRLYTAAARDFHLAFPPPNENGQAGSESTKLPDNQVDTLVIKARQRFAAVLALPAEQNASRVVWAAYSLGRIADYQDNTAEAAAQFQKTRELVKSGLPDPLGLAVASLGEEAGMHLRHGEVKQATRLYREQMAYGSASAVNSLKQVARTISKDSALLDQALSDPLTQRLLFAYQYTQNVGTPFSSLENYLDTSPKEASSTEPTLDVWERIAASIEKQGIDQVAGADWLAALAYQRGRFKLAQRLVKKDNSPLSYWIKAKLALRAGNQTAALAAYAQAAKGFPSIDKSNPAANEDNLIYRIDAERGVLRLARGEYQKALEYLYSTASNYWTDAAYVAERVLTVGELQSFVDRHVPAPSKKEMEAPTYYKSMPALRMRQLLARRLMRDRRFKDALRYFDDPKLKSLAEHYHSVFNRANNRKLGRIDRAKAWYETALLARNNGMELLGYELAPDFANEGGFYDHAGGPDKVEGEFTTADERRRFKASCAKPDVRLHYRVVAADYAAKAADFLPRHSQAFAAVLCQAASWNLNDHPEYAKPLYKRYVREGAYFLWAENFGKECPEPDFASLTQPS
ncbi:MAG: hypothetical protein ACU83U_14655 [Gammaproteobacteria bacterium]